MYRERQWNGFTKLEFLFEDHEACLVYPPEENKTPHWALKTEYFSAFNDTAILLLNKGYHFAYIQNDHRWGGREDLARKKRFGEYLQKEFHLLEKCVPIGLSCGGLIAIKLAGIYPEMVSVLYIDAPVVDLLSMLSLGRHHEQHEELFRDEILQTFQTTVSQMLSYRDHPLDWLPSVIAHKIPTVLVYGGKDTVVFPDENAEVVKRAFRGTDVPFLCICKPTCDHHPHGLEDPTPVVDFILQFDKD